MAKVRTKNFQSLYIEVYHAHIFIHFSLCLPECHQNLNKNTFEIVFVSKNPIGGSAASGLGGSLTPKETQPRFIQPVAITEQKKIFDRKKWQLKDFEVDRTLGVGGFARVVLVRIKATSDRNPFAMKMWNKYKLANAYNGRISDAASVVKGEAMVLSMLTFPFIVNMLTAFQDDRRVFMLLEFVNGGELHAGMWLLGC